MNPIRAGIVDKPEDYRWNTLGYLVQRGNKDPSEILLRRSLCEFHGTGGLLDLNLGMHEWNEFNPSEIIRKYRQFVYETGAIGGRSQESGIRSQESEEGTKRHRHEDRRKGAQEKLST